MSNLCDLVQKDNFRQIRLQKSLKSTDLCDIIPLLLIAKENRYEKNHFTDIGSRSLGLDGKL